jgi:hypothetical protein
MTTPTTADANADNDPKTETKPQTLLSILCHEPWYGDSDGWSTVTFQKDGTGEVPYSSTLNLL